MDDRSREIREGAGLEESRINTELLDLINKYSSHVLIVLAIVVGGYAGKQFLDRRANDRVNDAFAQHADITETASPSPQSLSALAEQYGDVRGIGTMARLREADVYVRAVATGMKPGAAFELDPETQEPTNRVAEGDLLSADERDEYLSKADALYEQVIAGTEGEPYEAVHALGAWFGRAAVAESRGDDDAAAAAYRSAAELARESEFPMYAALAEQRVASLESGLPSIDLYAEADLPEIPEPEPPAPIDPPADTGPVGPVLPDAGAEEAPADVTGNAAGDEPVDNVGDDTGDAAGEPGQGDG